MIGNVLISMLLVVLWASTSDAHNDHRGWEYGVVSRNISSTWCKNYNLMYQYEPEPRRKCSSGKLYARHKHPRWYDTDLYNAHRVYHGGRDQHSSDWHYVCIDDDSGSPHYHEEGGANMLDEDGNLIDKRGKGNSTESCPPEGWRPPRIITQEAERQTVDVDTYVQPESSQEAERQTVDINQPTTPEWPSDVVYPPTDFMVVRSEDGLSASFTWASPADTTGIKDYSIAWKDIEAVRRRAPFNAAHSVLVHRDSTSYTKTGLDPTITYYWRIRSRADHHRRELKDSPWVTFFTENEDCPESGSCYTAAKPTAVIEEISWGLIKELFR